MSKLEILKNSLKKKEQLLEEKIENHFADVKRANGQPLNDKRNGNATVNRWDKQSNALRNLQASIEKTKKAIEIEEDKIAGITVANMNIPEEILELVRSGEITQWRKFPHIFFIPGVKKARIYLDAKTQIIYPSYEKEITDPHEWKLFSRTFNKMRQILIELLQNKGTANE